MRPSTARTLSQAEAFDRLLDVIAEEIVERYLAELEGSAGSDRAYAPPHKETTA